MFIEFVGPSGSGKSTIYREVIKSHRNDLTVGQEMAYQSLIRRAIKRRKLKAYFSAVIARKQSKKTGDRQLLKEFGLPEDCVDLCHYVFENFKVHPKKPVLYFERIRRFQSTLAQYSTLASRPDLADGIVAFDEFFTQRCLAMSIYADNQREFISSFFKRAPKAQLYVFVEAHPELVRERITRRGRNNWGLHEFDENFTGAVILKELLVSERINVLTLSGSQSLEKNVSLVSEALLNPPFSRV